MLDKTSSIICAFGLAAAAPRSPYRHLELCGIALGILQPTLHVELNANFFNEKINVKSHEAAFIILTVHVFPESCLSF